MNPDPNTIPPNFKPYTLHPTPYTLDPKPVASKKASILALTETEELVKGTSENAEIRLSASSSDDTCSG